MLSKKVFSPIAVVAALLVVAATAQAPTKVQVAAESRVKGPRILLGDVAVIEPASSALADLSLGESPSAGNYRWISRHEIESALRRQGRAFDQVSLEMPKRVLVVRLSQAVPASLIESEIRALFDSRGDGYRVESVEVPSSIAVSPGRVEIQVDDPGARIRPGEVSLKVSVVVDGRSERSVWVRARLLRLARVATAAHDLASGALIGPDDVVMREVRLDRRGEYVTRLQDVAGTVVRRRFREGQTITADGLHRPDAVRRGDFVKLTARGQGFLVSTMGRARSGGALGEIVAVENLQSKKVVHATVVGDKEVEVTLPGGRQ